MVSPRPALPTLVDLRRQWTELVGNEVEHQPEELASPAAQTPNPPPPCDSARPELALAVFGSSTCEEGVTFATLNSRWKQNRQQRRG